MKRNPRLLFKLLSNLLYALGSLGLMMFSLIMLWQAGVDVYDAFRRGQPLLGQILNGVGLIIIAMAIFDVAKFLMEEEVLSERELRSSRESRQTLNKFMTIIIIAVSLEALVFIFGAGKKDVTTLLYPTLLFLAAIVAMVGLGLYQRLTMHPPEHNRPDPDAQNSSPPSP